MSKWVMGSSGERVFPRVMNALMDTKETRRIRSQVWGQLSGEVLEIGLGTGHNLPFLPDAVTRLWAVDPLTRGRELAAARIDRIETYYAKGGPKPLGWTFQGRAAAA